jgi:CRP/FNR family transcriptional regulator
MLKLSKLLPDGRRQITGFLLPGDYLGLAFAERYICSAEAVTPVRLCRFPRSAFLALLDQFPALEKALLGRAATELAAAQKQMLLLGRKTARERVASFLLQLAEREGADDGMAMDLPMTRTDIADYLGLTIETVSRTLTNLRKTGLIALPDPHHLSIVHRTRLDAEAGG